MWCSSSWGNKPLWQVVYTFRLCMQMKSLSYSTLAWGWNKSIGQYWH